MKAVYLFLPVALVSLAACASKSQTQSSLIFPKEEAQLTDSNLRELQSLLKKVDKANDSVAQGLVSPQTKAGGGL